MRAFRFCAFAFVIALASGATLGCARRGSVDPKAPIIIISIDTLRSDHLPAYGYTRIETPALDRLPADDLEHFAAVRALLDDAGVAYEVDSTLVRGLDYYTRTLFEFQTGLLDSAQNALGGGSELRLLNYRDTTPLSAGQVLTEADRTLLQETFGCPVFNRYG